MFNNLNASFYDKLNLILTIMFGMINTKLCFTMFIYSMIFFIIHILLSKHKYKKLRNNLFN